MFDKDGMNQVVAAAVVAALDDQAPKLLGEVVQTILNKKVNATNGGEPRYGNEVTWLEYLAQNQLSMIVQQTVREWFETQRDSIKTQVIAHLNEDKMAELMVKKMGEALQYSNVNIEFKNNLD